MVPNFPLLDLLKGIISALVPGLHPASFQYHTSMGVALAYGIFLTLSALPAKLGMPHPHFARGNVWAVWWAVLFALLLLPLHPLLSIAPPREILLAGVVAMILLFLSRWPVPFVSTSIFALIMLRLFGSDLFPLFSGLYGGSIGGKPGDTSDPFWSALLAIPLALLVAYFPAFTVYPLLAFSGIGFPSVLPAAYAALHIFSYYTYKPRTFLALHSSLEALPFLIVGMAIGTILLYLFPKRVPSLPAIPILFLLNLWRGFNGAVVFLLSATLAAMLREKGYRTHQFSGFLLLPTLVVYLS